MSDQEREELRKRKLDELRRLFHEGIESGPRIPAEEVFATLKARYADKNTDK